MIDCHDVPAEATATDLDLMSFGLYKTKVVSYTLCFRPTIRDIATVVKTLGNLLKHVAIVLCFIC